jgi:zinc D-Ala-D-Ala carboxypeptidase
MPLAATAKLAPNFTAAELGADNPAADATIVANLRRVAEWLQAARGILGVPLRVTSGFRTSARNAEVGGSASSDHVAGLAADFAAVGLTPFNVYQQLNKAVEERKLPAFDQLVYYAVDDHVHVGLGAQMRGQVLLKTTEGSYVQLAGAYVTKIRGYL